MSNPAALSRLENADLHSDIFHSQSDGAVGRHELGKLVLHRGNTTAEDEVEVRDTSLKDRNRNELWQRLDLSRHQGHPAGVPDADDTLAIRPVRTMISAQPRDRAVCLDGTGEREGG